LKEDREGLKKLLAKRRQIDAVIVAYKDRLTYFGFEVKLFKAYGVNVIVAFQDEKDYVQELVKDFVEIVKSFAPRIYGQECEKVLTSPVLKGEGSHHRFWTTSLIWWAVEWLREPLPFERGLSSLSYSPSKERGEAFCPLNPFLRNQRIPI